MSTTGPAIQVHRRPSARLTRAALVLGASLVALSCTGAEPPQPPYEPRLLDAPCPPEVSESVLTEHTCWYLVVPEDRSKPNGATIRVFVVRVMPPSGDPASDPLVLLGGNLGEVPGYGNFAPAAARMNRELLIVEARGSGRSRPSLTCPEVADAEWDLLSIPMSDPAYNETFLSAAGACFDRLLREGIDPSHYNLEEMAADVEDLRRALGIEEWNLMTLGTASRIALEVLDRYPAHVRSVILDSPEFPGDGGFDWADEATREAISELARYCETDPGCKASFPAVAGALGRAAARLAERPIREQITLPEGRRADAVIDGGLLVRLVRWELGRPQDEPGIANVPALIYDALRGRFDQTFELESTHATCIGYGQPCWLNEWIHGFVFSELCHDELPFAHPVAAEPGYDQAFGHHPFLDLCRAWKVPPGDPPRLIRSDVPALVLVGQMNPNISQPVLDEAMAGLDGGFLVTIAGLGSNVLGRECPREIRNAWIEQPLRPPDTSCMEDLPRPVFIAPISHEGLGMIPQIPEGTYRVKITTADGFQAGLGDSAAAFAGVLTLTLQDGTFRLHWPGTRRHDEIGVYRGDGHEVTFVVDEPFVFAGWEWTVRWRARHDRLALTNTEMSSREDALFFANPGYLAVIGMWMESHPWRRLDRSD